ncbi:RICIN domain-containing protein [Janthinobacterium sp. 17J80-10]|uniref:RICIN domain-containing protein n=1 Tax=Janthinobacterium sp. 17J80-10 TaxID=2497863 RepID=UPI0013E8D88C|nr:RICIN domain-containing protein [Janthinobacterium sp. 17J80-10]
MAATASLLLMTACGGGSDGEASANSTTSTSTADTTTTEATTSTTEATTSTTAATTTTAGTTTTTLADPFNLAAATLAVQHSGFCMTVSDAVVGSNARQFACVTGNVSQSWEIKPAGTSYTIRNLQSNLCLLVNDAALNVDPNVLSFAVQGTCDGSAKTLWNFQQSPTAGEFNIVSKHSNLCLDVTASDVTPGKEIIQYTCNSVANQPNQRWKFTSVAP